MQPYQTIARRYRPQNFSQVIGQEVVVTILQNALKLKRIANAYLFSGTKGTGKTTLARIFAKALNCLEPKDQEPCNKCDSCLQIQNHSSLDVLEIDGASNRGIDDIRQINETCGYAPAIGKYKIYIIDEVHMLTKEAFNALLKTLEEPPSHVKFFFATTEAHKVLPTILSRCQRFDLCRLSPELIISKLKKIATDVYASISEDAYKLLANLSNGSLRDAESILDQLLCMEEKNISSDLIQKTLGIFSIDIFFQFDQAFNDNNYSFAFSFAEKLFQKGIDISYFLESFLEHIRNILASIFQIPLSNSIFTNEQLNHYRKIKSLYSKDFCFYAFQTIMKQIEGRTISSQTHLELFLLHLLEAKNRVTLSQVMQELDVYQKNYNQLKPPVQPDQSVQVKQDVVIKKPIEPTISTGKDLETLLQFASVELHGNIIK